MVEQVGLLILKLSMALLLPMAMIPWFMAFLVNRTCDRHLSRKRGQIMAK